jgi:hypothetical protein
MSASPLLASFSTPERAANAVSRLRKSGHQVSEAYAPMPAEDLAAAIGTHPSRIRRIMFIAASAGVVVGIALQWYSAVIAYPINVGGRPLASWPAFVPVAFELGVLFAALAGFAAFLVEARLTRVHARQFSFDGFERASQDRYLIEIRTEDEPDARRLLEQIGAVAIARLERET